MPKAIFCPWLVGQQATAPKLTNHQIIFESPLSLASIYGVDAFALLF